MSISRTGFIELAHGSGGRATQNLIEEVFQSRLDNDYLRQSADQAMISISGEQLAIATDSHVISPIFFPGGDIGSLSVYGTVNDVALSGAVPRYLSAGFILEEGFPIQDLDRIAASMADAARECDIQIVTGDTKVVEKGRGDGIYINTTGVGVRNTVFDLSPFNIQPGDRILVSGTLGDHGTAVMAARNEMHLTTQLLSDSQSLHDLIAIMLDAVPEVRTMRDPTRGGLSACLNELAQTSGCSFLLNEAALPIRPEVQAISELLGLDLLTIANEGKLVAFCPEAQAEQLLLTMKAHPKGTDAAIIGEVKEQHDDRQHAMVSMQTGFGGQRLIDWQWSDSLPRIC